MNILPKYKQLQMLQQPLLEHRYNDDLLLREENREQAKEEFQSIYHVLDDPYLRSKFQNVNEQANLAKKHSRNLGLLSVLFGLASLMGASSEAIWENYKWAETLAIISGCFGIFAAGIGFFGVMIGDRKTKWLHMRLYTERLRQWYFQTMIWRISEIAQSLGTDNPDAHNEYRQLRQKWLSGFINEQLNGKIDSMLASILDANNPSEPWVHDRHEQQYPKLPQDFEGSEGCAELFAAYRKLRFLEQLGYANYMLRETGYSLLSFPLCKQQKLISFIWLMAFTGLVGLHALILSEHLFKYLPPLDTPQAQLIVHVSIIWLALVAIALRTLEEGLTIPHEIERYQEYRANVRNLLSQFDSAKNAKEKILVMFEMEVVVFEEMRSFLRTNHNATFVF